MTIPRLSSVLFEQDGNKTTSTTAFEPPAFALFEPYQYSLVLINVPNFVKLLKTKGITEKDVYLACAGAIDVGKTPDKCLAALQVKTVVGSPNYKGAGITMYKLASKYYNRPLTSDRQHSTSIAGRETWAKIENNPDWKKVGNLDNFVELEGDNVYATFSGQSFPERDVIKWRPEPNTDDPNDDCRLPSKYGELKTMSDMAKYVGTTDAYKYKGSLTVEPLITHGKDLLRWIEARGQEANPEKVNAVKLIHTLSNHLFNLRYKGTETPR